MSLLKHLLFEIQSNRILYHFTPKRNAIWILKDDILGLSSGIGEDYLSLTRNKTLGVMFGDVRFTIDADKLNSNYKIRPHLDPSYDANKKSYNYYDNMRRNEQEERVYKPITNFSNYILKIDIQIDYESEKYSSETKKLVDSIPNNINYEFVKEFQ